MVRIHIHNEVVLTFFRMNKNNEHVKEFLKGLNEELDFDYLEYLEENIGDDASFTMKELILIKEGKVTVTGMFKS